MKVVVLDDGNRANFNQAVGIAERLPGAEIETIMVPPLSFFRRVCLLLAANLASVIPLFKVRFLLRHIGRINLSSSFPKPAVIISTGAKSAPINLLLSRCVLARSVQVLCPEFLSSRLFDLLVMPEHDLVRYPKVSAVGNLMSTKGATNRIKPFILSPRGEDKAGGVNIAVLVGGDDKNYRVSEEWAERFCERLKLLSEKLPAKIYLTTSRRTPVKAEEVFRKVLGNDPEKFNLVLYRQTFANPVAEFLAAADLVLATEDSVSMVSEAASSGKPTAALKVGRRREKRLVFDQALEDLAGEGYIRLWSLEDLIPSKVTEAIRRPDRKVLAETEKVSARVLELLKREKILIVGVSCLGDNLILSPAYRTTRENFPLAGIDIITDRRSAGYFEGNPEFREIFYYNKKAGRQEKKIFLRKIQREKYDYVFDFRASIFGVASKAKKKANFYLQTLPGARSGEHETDRSLRMLAYFLPISPDRSFFFPLSKEDTVWAEETLGRLKLKERNFVVLNPGGRWDKKRWPPERFAEQAGFIWQNYHLASVVVGDKNETEIAGKIISSSSPIINLSGQTTVRQLTALLSKAALLISNDTGTVHLASASRCPTVVLFGPGDWRRYGPYQTEYRIVSSGLACSPCLKVACRKNFFCWDFITPDKVLKEVAPLLGKQGRYHF